MLFLDVIATPFYLLLGGAGFLILFAIGSVIVLTMIICAIFQRSKDQDKDPTGDEKDNRK